MQHIACFKYVLKRAVIEPVRTNSITNNKVNHYSKCSIVIHGLDVKMIHNELIMVKAYCTKVIMKYIHHKEKYVLISAIDTFRFQRYILVPINWSKI